MSSAPTLHILAGPNGAGKSTLYETRLKGAYPNAEFVNADLLAKSHYGHHAVTLEEAQTGQRLAEERRAALMAARKDLITESTFSHPSKLDLVKEAKSLGYRVFIHHVNVRKPELSIARVSSRVDKGGHPVPEDKIRERYERNKEIIRAAVLVADRAVVWDNSKLAQPATKTIQFAKGLAVWASQDVPAWARELYGKELQHFSAARLNPAAASFKTAKDLIEARDPGARVNIARPGRYQGPIVADTELHVVQKLDVANGPTKPAGSYVAHFKKVLQKLPAIGAVVEITHAVGKISTVQNLDQVLATEALKLSLRAAIALGKRLGGDKARTTEAERGKNYRGPVLAHTDHHIVQGGRSAIEFIAHRKEDLAATPKVGAVADIRYSTSTKERATVTERTTPAADKNQPEQDRDR